MGQRKGSADKAQPREQETAEEHRRKTPKKLQVAPQELIEEALEKVRQAVAQEDTVCKQTMDSLVQLLKLRKEYAGQTEGPETLEIVWTEDLRDDGDDGS